MSNVKSNLKPNKETSPQVEIINGQAMTSSIQVAQLFEKQHKNILQSIENLFIDLPQDFRELNFQLTLYSTDLGQSVRQDKAYHLTRDAFTLLAMGFTGKRAMQFKIAYIEAFNRMEKALKGQVKLDRKPQLKTINYKQKQILLSLIFVWANLTQVPYDEVLEVLLYSFELEDLNLIAQRDYKAVLSYILVELARSVDLAVLQPLTEEAMFRVARAQRAFEVI